MSENEMMADAITRDAEIMHGTPVFRGTRVPVQTLFEYLQGGETLEDFLEGFPTVSRSFGARCIGRSKTAALGPGIVKLLLDERVDESARFARLAGLKNGDLLAAAEAGGLDVLLTVHWNIPSQQNLGGRRLSIVIL